MTEETNTAIARAFETVTAALTRETRESFADVLARVSAALPDEAARAALRERLIAFAAEDTPAARKLAVRARPPSCPRRRRPPSLRPSLRCARGWRVKRSKPLARARRRA